MDNPGPSEIDAGFAKMKLSEARRHLLLCVGPDCCSPEAGLQTWDYLKRRLAELKLPALRTKAACFRVCCGGPWLVVYPDGIWYGEVTPERCERIIVEHVRGGKPIADWVVRTHPLPSSEI